MDDEKLPPLADDLVVGADQISIFLYGDAAPRTLRDVYRNPLGLTFFKHGNFLAALKSTLRREVAEAESRAREARKAHERSSICDSGEAA
jgi:hypothetical protein